MSGKTWVVADPHFGHENICNFLRKDGTKLRPFANADEMHNAIVPEWNANVGASDRVYILGDVAMRPRHLEILKLLNGRHVLVKGNHDIAKLPDYAKYFDDIRSYVIGGAGDTRYIMSHIPIHPDSLGRFRLNIHGHLHDGVVLLNGEPDRRYKCVSMEHTGYRPISIDEILKERADVKVPAHDEYGNAT